MTDNNGYKGKSGQSTFRWRGFEKRSHAAERVISLPFIPKKHQQFNWTPQTPQKTFLQYDKKRKEKKSDLHADSEFKGENALLVWEWRVDAFTGCWLRFGKGLHRTWPDKKKKKDHTDRSTSMSAQLICKVIRILETLISIILMNLDGRPFFPSSVKKRKTRNSRTSGKYCRARCRGRWGCCGTVWHLESPGSFSRNEALAVRPKWKGLPQRSTLLDSSPSQMTVRFGGSQTNHTAAGWFISNGK